MKNVRWKIYFTESKFVNPRNYRVDIYDEEYSGTPIILQGGDVPLTTEEDNSDDVFAPLRKQSGTLQICTKLPNGGLFELAEILPSDTLDRPVRLIYIDDNNTEHIEWQGFIDCKMYTQDFTNIPQNIELPLISVLEAMDSVEIDLSEDKTFLKIIGHIALAMQAIETKAGISLFSRMYISNYCKDAMTTQFLYNNEYFTENEVVSGENVFVEVHSISCKEILERVSKFFGAVWRETGQDIYMDVIGKTSMYSVASFSSIVDAYINNTGSVNWAQASVYLELLSTISWKGTDHKQNIKQGAKRVEVSSNLKDFSVKMSLKETPMLSLVTNPVARQSTWGEVRANTNYTYYNLAENRKGTYGVTVAFDQQAGGGKRVTFSKGNLTTGINYLGTWFWQNDEYLDYYSTLFQPNGGSQGTTSHVVGSFTSWVRVQEDNGEHNWVLKPGLMLYGLPEHYQFGSSQYLGMNWPSFNENDYIFKQKTPLIFCARKGKFVFNMQFDAIFTQNGAYQVWSQKNNSGERRGFVMAIKWGNKYAKLATVADIDFWTWENSFTTINVLEHKYDSEYKMDGKMELEIPISDYNNGFITIYIYPKIFGNWPNSNYGYDTAHALFLTKLELNYEPPKEELKSNRGSNTYIEDTGHPFTDELSTKLDISSYASNDKLATMIWTDEYNPTQLITLGNREIRPELDLLARLKDYYSYPRRNMELEIDSLGVALSRRKIIYNTKIYLPLAEKKDYQENKSTITCIEVPT